MNDTRAIQRPSLLTGHIVFLLLVAGLVVAFWGTFEAISIEWLSNGPYSHGFLALAVIAVMFWQDRALIASPAPRPAVPGLLFALGSGSAWLVASLVNVQLIQVLGLYGLILGSIWATYGWRVLLRLRVPLFALALVLPIWNILQIPLQELSSDVSQSVLNGLNIPVLREGFRFTLPGGQFIVEEACSGLGFLLTSMLLSLFYSHYNGLDLGKSTFFFLFAVGLAIFSNWIRIVLIMVMGNELGMEHAIVQDHLTFGWFVFTAMLIPFFVVGRYLDHRDRKIPVTTEDTLVGEPGVVNKLVPGSALLVMALFPVVLALLMARESAPVTPAQFSWLDSADAIEGQRVGWQPTFIGADAIDFHTMSYGGRKFVNLIVRYDQQTQGSELIFVNNQLYDEEAWFEIERLHADVAGTAQGVNLIYLRNGRGQGRVIAYYYIVADEMVVTSRVLVKFGELLGQITGHRASYLVAFATDYPETQRTAAAGQMLDFVQDLLVNQPEPGQVNAIDG
ncbi:MAG: exosortase [Pseudomonadota bacterium]